MKYTQISHYSKNNKALARRWTCVTGICTITGSTRGTTNSRVLIGSELRQTSGMVQSYANSCTIVFITLINCSLIDSASVGHVSTNIEWLQPAQHPTFSGKWRQRNFLLQESGKQRTDIEQKKVTSKGRNCKVLNHALTVQWSNFIHTPHQHSKLLYVGLRTDHCLADWNCSISSFQQLKWTPHSSSTVSTTTPLVVHIGSTPHNQIEKGEQKLSKLDQSGSFGGRGITTLTNSWE